MERIGVRRCDRTKENGGKLESIHSKDWRQYGNWTMVHGQT